MACVVWTAVTFFHFPWNMSCSFAFQRPFIATFFIQVAVLSGFDGKMLG